MAIRYNTWRIVTFVLSADLRLANGNQINSGRLEVKIYGEWGTVCDDGFSDDNANVVCKDLGFHRYEKNARVHNSV